MEFSEAGGRNGKSSEAGEEFFRGGGANFLDQARGELKIATKIILKMILIQK